MKIPFKVVHWECNDFIAPAEGWIVVNNLVNGVASGGIFMHPSATQKEVEDLSYTMSLKNTLQSPIIGGTKGGIKYDHNLPDANCVLKQFLIDNKTLIKDLWNTGADLNTDNIVIANIVKNDLGLSSPFISLALMLTGEEVVSESFSKRINSKVSSIFTLGNSVTGFSVATTIKFLFPNITPRLCIQGFGNVGSSLIYYCAVLKLANIVSIIEHNYCIYGENLELYLDNLLKIKYDIDELKKLCNKNNLLFSERSNKFKTDEDFLVYCLTLQKAEIFSPCAARYIMTKKVYDHLLKYLFYGTDIPWIISGANNIFYNQEIQKKVLYDLKIKVIPEWISNCGNTIMFNEVLKIENNNKLATFKILGIIEERIFDFLEQGLKHYNSNPNIFIDMAIKKIKLVNSLEQRNTKICQN